jgi:uncharacterized protein YjbI with pentapeptide repeats
VNDPNRPWTSFDLTGAKFDGAWLDGAILSEANLRNAVFRDASLKGADLSDADVTGASFAGAELASASFHRAKGLRSLDLRGVDLNTVEPQPLVAGPQLPTRAPVSSRRTQAAALGMSLLLAAATYYLAMTDAGLSLSAPDFFLDNRRSAPFGA